MFETWKTPLASIGFKPELVLINLVRQEDAQLVRSVGNGYTFPISMKYIISYLNTFKRVQSISSIKAPRDHILLSNGS